MTGIDLSLRGLYRFGRAVFSVPLVDRALVLRFMGQGYRFLCRAEARRLLLLMGATVALIILVQHFEFPSSSVLLSLFPLGNASSVPFGESSTNSINTTSIFHESINSSEASNVKEVSSDKEAKELKENRTSIKSSNATDNNAGHNGYVSDEYTGRNKSSTLENGANSVDGHAAGEAMAPNISDLPLETPFMNVAGDNSSKTPKSGSLDSNLVFPPSVAPLTNELSDSGIHGDTKSSTPVAMVSLNSSSTTKDAAATLSVAQNSDSPISNYSVSGSGGSPAAAPIKHKNAPSKVFSIAQMNVLLLQSQSSSLSMAPKWPSKADEEVLFARSQIETASAVKNDDGLYAPIYRNFSMFKRSYDLMEEMLKVYIYPDGEKPIFHQSILEGIYASEGWFMKHMEANEKFVTKDPKKAHLFYFPFSSRLLELTLYVRHSHSRSNLIEYTRQYVDMIAAKYSSWNRTSGVDHFLAACHDWAPAETRGPMLNCIRALCNADIGVGFSIGKDVSLPETYVRSAQSPNKNLEGNPPSERPTLAFFAGNLHGYVRPILLEYWGNKDPDMKIFGPMPHVKGNANYIQLMKSSKYCICPKGHEVNSPRIVESFFYECVPVIISDNYVPPFFEVLDWESFAVFVLERDIPNLKNILVSISDEKYIEMHKRVKMVQQHFLWHNEPVKYDLFHMILHSVWYNRVFLMKPA